MHYALLETFAHQSRDLLRLSGPDTARFVQGTVTANVEAMPPGTAVAACLCTVKGKVVTELVVLDAGEAGIDLLVPRAIAVAVATSLDRHIIMDDVEVAAPQPVAVAVAWDDQTAPTIEGAAGHEVRTFATKHPGPGTLVVGSPEAVAAALAAGAAVDAPGWCARRIATATPAWGHEILADVFPPEVGFVSAVAYDKGCFMGQEPLARIHARGQVNRVMVRVKLDSLHDLPPHPDEDGGPAVLDADDNTVGRLSTWAPQTGGRGGLGLAIVRRKAAVPGHTLRCGERVVEVLTPPLGDDPGLGGAKRSATVKLGRR